jgi:O-Antigen ligase
MTSLVLKNAFKKISFLYFLYIILLVVMFGPLALCLSRAQILIIILFSLFLLGYGVIVNFLASSSKIIVKKSEVSLSILLFYVYLLLSVLYGISRNNEISYILGDIYPFLEFIAFFVITFFIVKEEKQVLTITKLLVVVMTIKAIWLLYLFFTGKLLEMQLAFSDEKSLGTVGEAIVGRPIEPNISLVIPIILISLSFDLSKKIKSLLASILFIYVLVTILSLTRSIWVSCIVTIFVTIGLTYFYGDKRKAKKTLLNIMLSALLIGIVINVVTVEQESLYDLLVDRILYSVEQLDTELGRLRIYEVEDALNDFYEQPILGQGIGGSIITLDRVGNEAAIAEKGYIHNYPLGLMLKIGSIGMLLLIAVVAHLIKKTILLMKKDRNTMTSFYGTAFLVVLFGFVNFLIFQPITIAYHTFALLGILYSLLHVQSRQRSNPVEIRH